jgi:hypothetical protein
MQVKFKQPFEKRAKSTRRQPYPHRQKNCIIRVPSNWIQLVLHTKITQSIKTSANSVSLNFEHLARTNKKIIPFHHHTSNTPQKNIKKVYFLRVIMKSHSIKSLSQKKVYPRKVYL